MKNPKWLICSTYIPPYKSGSGENAVRFAEYLTRNSYRVSILTFKRGQGLTDDGLSDISKTIIKLPVNNLLSKFWFRILFFFRLPKILKDIEVVYIVGPCPGYKLLILVSNFLKISVIYRSTLLTADDLLCSALSGISVKKRISLTIISTIDLYIAINQEFERMWKSLPHKRGKMLLSTQGVDSTVFFPPLRPEIEFNRTLLNFPPPDVPIIISVGNVTLRKGYDEIFRSLSQVHQNFLYIILGEYNLGSPAYYWSQQTEKENLVALGKSLLKHKVQFLGYIENPDIYYKSADIFVSFSEVEGFPNSILEAMACGLPIICKNLKGVTDWFFSPEFSIECHNEEELTSAVSNLLVDKKRRTSMGAKSGEFASENFSFDTFLKKVNGLL